MVYPGETSEEARKRVWDEARSSWLALDKESMEAGFDVALLPFLQFEVRCLNFELRTASKIVSFQVGVGFWHWVWLIANLPFQSMSQTRFQKPTPLTLGGKHVQSSLKIEFEVQNSKFKNCFRSPYCSGQEEASSFSQYDGKNQCCAGS